MLHAIAGSVIRHGATTSGGALAAIGAVAQDPISGVAGAVLALGGFALSAYKEATRHALELEIERAKHLPAGGSCGGRTDG